MSKPSNHATMELIWAMRGYWLKGAEGGCRVFCGKATDLEYNVFASMGGMWDEDEDVVTCRKCVAEMKRIRNGEEHAQQSRIKTLGQEAG